MSRLDSSLVDQAFVLVHVPQTANVQLVNQIEDWLLNVGRVLVDE